MEKSKKVKKSMMTTSEIFVWFNYKKEEEGKTDIEIENEFEKLIKKLQNEKVEL